MTAAPHLLAEGPGWRADDVVCHAGPHDRPFEEQHDTFCIAVVMEGTFQYRSTPGTALLAPGAILLGNARQCFECGHEHGTGDRCLSFHFAPDWLEAVASSVPGASLRFTVPRLPPLPALAPTVAAAHAACEEGEAAALEEAALQLAGSVLAALAEEAPAAAAPSSRDARRISRALRRIEAAVDEPLPLAQLADQAAMSPYHFLRTFRAVVGMTPHQYVLCARLHRAAVRLRRSADSVSQIAFEAGFNDLSTFNRRFRRFMGVSPGVYRQRAASASR